MTTLDPSTDQETKPSISAWRADVWDTLLKGVILLSSALLVYGSVRGHLFTSLLHAAREHRYYYVIEKPSVLWALMGTCMICLRTVFWFRYRSFPAIPFADAPRLTVVIPAYNEGPMVSKSIDSVASAHYPRDRLEIVVVDDGSKDDTWEHIQAAAARHPGLVRPIRFEKNRGKRAALEAGMRRSDGEIVVTIDSDSIIEQGALLEIAGPFRNPKVGAVAGKVSVLNRHAGLIPRMLHVRFILSFDFLRAAQSGVGIVYCCPGALSAYRLSVVREVLDDWMGQRFLGVACTYGEDRAMTNFILARGYKTLYQRSAVVHTVVPATYAKLCKMYLRWDRSYIREEFHFARVFRRQPILPALYSLVDVSLTNLRYPMAWASLVLLAMMVGHDPGTLVRVALAIGVMSTLNTLYVLRSERSFGFLYGVLYAYFGFTTLFWIFPYALATVRSRSWMTR